jgi:hypothetical protein
MAAMKTCEQCDGFIPRRARTCPNCGAAARPANGFLRRARRSLFAAAGGGAAAITLMACYGATYRPMPPPANASHSNMAQQCEPSETDKDADCVQVPQDCNDEDAAIRPGVADQLGDGIDQNCDGQDGVASE